MASKIRAINQIVWEGSVNLDIEIDPEICVDGLKDQERSIIVSLRRNNYISYYLPGIRDQFLNVIKDPTTTAHPEKWFFEIAQFENVPLLWNYPIGAIFDTYVDQKTTFNPDCLHKLKLTLKYSEVPKFKQLIPLYDGTKQIRMYWMHQWKQACYIMHRNAKKVMSLKVEETDQFWNTYIENDFENFTKFTRKITSVTGHIPIRISTTAQIIQPICEANIILKDLLLVELNGSFRQVLIQGIEVETSYQVKELYRRFSSFDGFLYVCVK